MQLLAWNRMSNCYICILGNVAIVQLGNLLFQQAVYNKCLFAVTCGVVGLTVGAELAGKFAGPHMCLKEKIIVS